MIKRFKFKLIKTAAATPIVKPRFTERDQPQKNVRIKRKFRIYEGSIRVHVIQRLATGQIITQV